MSIESAVAALREFHTAFEHGIADRPTLDVPDHVKALRLNLITEELDELAEALGWPGEAGDLVEVADALMDLLYVVYGACLTFGIPVGECFAEVHRSNMSKLGPNGEHERDANGKTVKGPHFSPPNLAPILEAAGWQR